MIRTKWEFFCNTCIADLHCDRMFPRFSTEFSEPSELSSESKKLIDLIMGIHGVAESNARGDYTLSIEKGAVFEWSEIQPRVEQAVYEFFAEELVTDD